MCRSETGEQHALPLVGEYDGSTEAEYLMGTGTRLARVWPRGSETSLDACWCLRARLRASVRSVQRPELVVSAAAAAVASSSAQAMQARRHHHHHLTGGGAHGWRICNRLCTLGGLVWAILLDVHGSGRRRGTLRYTYRHQYSLQVQ